MNRFFAYMFPSLPVLSLRDSVIVPIRTLTTYYRALLPTSLCGKTMDDAALVHLRSRVRLVIDMGLLPGFLLTRWVQVLMCEITRCKE